LSKNLTSNHQVFTKNGEGKSSMCQEVEEKRRLKIAQTTTRKVREMGRTRNPKGKNGLFVGVWKKQEVAGPQA